MDTGWMTAAYEAANEGDWSGFTQHLAPDYVHRVPSAGIEWHGPEEAVGGLRQVYEMAHMRQHVRGVTELGDYIVADVEVESDNYQPAARAVHVFRAAGDRIAEFVGVYPPAPGA